jgi:hypothetical protein
VPGLASSSSSDGFSLPVLLAAAGVAAVWLLVTAAIWLIRRPPGVDGTPATMDLGPEPPAIAALLCDGYDVRTETAPTTLLDLAAREVIRLEEARPGETVCMVPSTAASAALLPFEDHVLDALRSKAVDGIVPATALTTGTEDASTRWHRRLAQLVVADAQSRGLTVNRWPKTVIALVGLGVAVVVGLLVLAAQIGGDAEETPVLAGIAGAVAVGGAVVLSATANRMRRSFAQHPTSAGEQAEARWLGVRAHLAQNEQLGRLPPASVRLYGRHLAYAAGFGLAEHAVEALPFGEEDDHLAWSAHGGRWRRVRVRYPRVVPPGWGRHPALATFLGAIWGGLSVWLLTRFGDVDGQVGLIVTAVVGLPLLWAVWALVNAVPDLFTRRTLTATAVRCRQRPRILASNDPPKYWYYVALDDGSRDRVAACRVKEELYRQVRQGQTLTVDVTPRLGYVRAVR